LRKQLDYERWYVGHFHVDWNMERVQILFEEFPELDGELDLFCDFKFGGVEL
jgi:hypothetical protein